MTVPQPSMEQEARELEKALICPVCPGETLEESQAQLAVQMRALLREKLSEGWTRDQILEFFGERYGTGVFAAPPKRGFDLVAWLVPPLGLLVGFLILIATVRGMTRNRTTTTPVEPNSRDNDLQPYLDLVDQELGTIDREPSEQ